MKYDFLFQHIPRTGGTSLCTLLEEESRKHGAFALCHCNRRYQTPKAARYSRPRLAYIGHMSLPYVLSDPLGRKLIVREQVEGCTAFLFIRNPWDRLVSVYGMLTTVVRRRNLDASIISALRTFEDFAYYVCSGEAERDESATQFGTFLGRFGAWMALPQSRWYDSLRDADVLREIWVGRFESLHDEIDLMLRSLGIAPLSHKLARLATNKEEGELTRPYQEHYTPALRDTVGEFYAEDVRRFDYTFEGQQCQPNHG